MEFEFIKASEARKLFDFYEDVDGGSPIDELKNSINMGIKQKAQYGETSYRVYPHDEIHHSSNFVDGGAVREKVLRDIIMELQSLGFYIDDVVDPSSLEIKYFDVCW